MPYDPKNPQINPYANLSGLLGQAATNPYVDPRQAAYGGGAQALAPMMGYQNRPVGLGQVLAAAGGGMAQGMQGAQQQNLQMQQIQQKMMDAKTARDAAAQQKLAMGRLATENPELANIIAAGGGTQAIESLLREPKDDRTPLEKNAEAAGMTIQEYQAMVQQTPLQRNAAASGMTVQEYRESQTRSKAEIEADVRIEKEIEKALPNKRQAIIATRDRYNIVQGAITDAIGYSKKSGVSGIAGQIASFSPTSDAAMLSNSVAMIRSKVGLDELKALKATGATMGALNESELNLLIDSLGKLDPHQRPEKLRSTLNTISRLMAKAQNNDLTAFGTMYPEEQLPFGEVAVPDVYEEPAPTQAGTPANIQAIIDKYRR
ncbi:MAG: hypothetical protein KAS66_05325 [Candidatus Omnitrophica bacterium]|nr:hypothetical protein [Candidatus Omnitrophota bacterium]